VNYRTAALAERCLASLAQERARFPELGLRATVVDNASEDGSAERLAQSIAERGWGDWVELRASPENAGFAAGNNLALRERLASPGAEDLFLLVNPDVELQPGALGALVGFLADRPRIGFVGPATEVPRGVLRGSAFRFPGILNSFDEGLHFGPVSRLLARWRLAPAARDEPHRADWVSGGCVLARRRALEELGLFDEGFFLYFEEVDLMHRAGRHGWETWFVPSARVVHDAGASTGLSGGRELARRMPRYWFESRRRYFLKNRGWLVTQAASWAWVFGNALWNVRRFLTRAPRREPPRFFSDFLSLHLFGR